MRSSIDFDHQFFMTFSSTNQVNLPCALGEFPALVYFDYNSNVDFLIGVNWIINHPAELIQAGDSEWF